MVNQQYIKEFLKNGKSVENQFAKLFKNVETSTTEQDKCEHWDLMIKYKIDVKGLKKRNRNDEYPDETVHWVEIMNVVGKKGWLYAEEVDYFAFELNKYWIIVEKEKLQKFIAKNTTKEYVKYPSLNMLYRRKERKDTITLVSSFDLVYISECLIEKKIV